MVSIFSENVAQQLGKMFLTACQLFLVAGMLDNKQVSFLSIPEGVIVMAILFGILGIACLYLADYIKSKKGVTVSPRKGKHKIILPKNTHLTVEIED